MLLAQFVHVTRHSEILHWNTVAMAHPPLLRQGLLRLGVGLGREISRLFLDRVLQDHLESVVVLIIPVVLALSLHTARLVQDVALA